MNSASMATPLAFALTRNLYREQPTVSFHDGPKTISSSYSTNAVVRIQDMPHGEKWERCPFGGAGLYREGTMFAVVADDVAYLKVDDSNRDDFLRAGSAPFEPYPDKIKTTIRTYYEIPADILEDPAELAQWVQRSWIIARRTSKR